MTGESLSNKIFTISASSVFSHTPIPCNKSANCKVQGQIQGGGGGGGGVATPHMILRSLAHLGLKDKSPGADLGLGKGGFFFCAVKPCLF